jgi:hypothetical protein
MSLNFHSRDREPHTKRKVTFHPTQSIHVVGGFVHELLNVCERWLVLAVKVLKFMLDKDLPSQTNQKTIYLTGKLGDPNRLVRERVVPQLLQQQVRKGYEQTVKV